MSRSYYPEFIDLIKKYDIIGIQESKTDDLDLINIPEYVVYFNNREKISRRKSGGIALLIKSELQPYVKVERNHFSKLVLWFSISHKLMSTESDVYCGVVYIPPVGSRYANEDPFSELYAEMNRYCADSSSIILMGDFNSRTGVQEDIFCSDEFLSDIHGLEFIEQELNDVKTSFLQNKISLRRESDDKSVNHYGTQMIRFCKYNDLYILNGRVGRSMHNAKYTCKDSSVIDYFLCSSSLFHVLCDLEVLDFSSLYSDAHCPISLTLQRCLLPSNTEIPTANKTKIRLWNHDKSNRFLENLDRSELIKIESKLSSMKGETELQQHDVDRVIMQINSLFEKCAEKSFGHIKEVTKPACTNITNKPWFRDKCHTARNHYHNARRLYNINRTEHNKQRLKQCSKLYKSTINSSVKEHKNLRIQKLKNMKSSNPREFWKILNSSNPKNECKAPLNDLYNYFKDVNDCQHTTICDETHYNLEGENMEINLPINEQEIRAAIKQLNNNKSAGIDNVKNEHIISTAPQMIPIYTKLFNIIFETALIPECWTAGVIKPIFKKGDPTLPQNYRPITLLSCLGKLFTSVINNRLNKYADKYNVIEEVQAGFRQNHSTADNIFVLKSLVDIAKANKLKLFSCFIDFKQAFDTVWRSGLWHKLNQYNINGKCLAVIQNIYKNVKSKVATTEGTTIFFPCLTGVRQGENLSPFLFSIFLNDLNHFLMSKNLNGTTCEFNSQEIYIYLKTMILLYADDTVLFSDSESDMQHALDVFHSYCMTWKLTVNVDKTNVVVFSSGQQQEYKFTLNGMNIEVKDEYKYLGIIFTRGGGFTRAKAHIAEQANKALFALLRKIRHLSLPLDMQLDLFDKTIKPILLYGAEVWGFGNCGIIERVHLKFLKYILRLKKSTPSHMIYGELGIFPITIDIRHRALTYWIKLIENSSNDTLGTQKLSTYLYSIIYNMQQKNKLKSQWLKNIKDLLCNIGFSWIWQNQIVDNARWLTAALKRKLQDRYIQEWMAKILDETTDGDANYRLIKTHFAYSKYLTILPERLSLKLLAFRTRNHRLPVEVDRWARKSFAERKCKHCNEVGDEFHYLLKCDLFTDDRKSLIKQYYYRRPNVIKYNELLNMTDPILLKKLAIFVNKILKNVRY